MKEFRYVITDEQGIHARPAGILVKQAAAFQSKITVENTEKGKSADAKRIMGVMALGVKNGQKIVLSIEGDDEEQAAQELEAFLKENL